MSKISTIILDLDHTLIHSVKVHPFFDHDEYCGGNGVLLECCEYICFKRPYVEEFLRSCFNKHHKVVLWSAGTKEYVLEIAYKLFSDYEFDLILTRENCVDYQKDFDEPFVKMYLKEKGIHIENPNHNIVFVDDIIERIDNFQNVKNIKIVEAKKFETKWESFILSRQKRNRPIREKDTYLKSIKF